MAFQIELFLNEQLGRLEVLVAIDLQFLPTERQQRLESLDAQMADTETVISEKLRKTMEALFVEAEYGDTIEVYQETIAIDGQPILVEIFRLGRMVLFYQNPGSQSVCTCREARRFPARAIGVHRHMRKARHPGWDALALKLKSDVFAD
jgi:hypothetical protein